MEISKKEITQELGLNSKADINAIRQAAVIREFRRSIGKRVILMQEAYPFLFVGKIEDIVSDFIALRVEISNISEFDGELFRIHLDTVQVFFIEDGTHVIPDIRT